MNPIFQLNGKQIDVDRELNTRSSVANGVAEALAEIGVDPDDIVWVNVEEEIHVENEGVLFRVYVETREHKANLIVDSNDIIRIN